MDGATGRSGHRGGKNNGDLDGEKKRVEVDSADGSKDVDEMEDVKGVLDSKGSNHSKPSSPEGIGSSSERKVDQLESTRAEMTQVKEENERLKSYLSQIMRDYRSLQMRFMEESKRELNVSSVVDKRGDEQRKLEEADDLVSLSLGRASSSIDPKKGEKKDHVSEKKYDDEEGLVLGLDCKFEASKSGTTESLPNRSPENSFEEEPKEDAGETWPPGKALNTKRSSNGDDEVLQQNPVKKARVSVRARCDTPTMNDGCQWRKYGQKIAKGNPCPRAYYRCTVAPSCPVRKQVQRCAEDMSILITTYEGNHNHPLPMSATAMASTTSAAAHMLLSGSTSSTTRPTTGNDLQAGISGLYPSDASKPRPFYTPSSSFSYASTSCPTITLDLTSNPPSSSASSASSIFGRFSSQYPSSATRFPQGSLNFGSISSTDSSCALPLLSWGGSNGLVNSLGAQLFNKGSTNPSATTQESHNSYQSYLQKTILNLPQSSLPDTISAATKVITADPSFQSALTAALKSIIGSNLSGSTTQDRFRS
ncbi:hypothetical protein MLD38_032765 [Melastoma candidum]|uniref:Uncharacterized protein n=1 Tax=Melastoma candidum TaxID=119954 RepID=A0ACB9M6V8_9MYRT|nr:hypothetical protein MLD38_032765 [Melastoma candidum]